MADPLFDALRKYADRNIVATWAGGGSKTSWREEVEEAAMRINAEQGLGCSEGACLVKAQSVADFSWAQMPKRARYPKV